MTLATEDPCLNIHEDHTLMYNVILNYYSGNIHLLWSGCRGVWQTWVVRVRQPSPSLLLWTHHNLNLFTTQTQNEKKEPEIPYLWRSDQYISLFRATSKFFEGARKRLSSAIYPLTPSTHVN